MALEEFRFGENLRRTTGRERGVARFRGLFEKGELGQEIFAESHDSGPAGDLLRAVEMMVDQDGEPRALGMIQVSPEDDFRLPRRHDDG